MSAKLVLGDYTNFLNVISQFLLNLLHSCILPKTTYYDFYHEVRMRGKCGDSQGRKMLVDQSVQAFRLGTRDYLGNRHKKKRLARR